MTRVLILIKGLGRGGAEQLAVSSLRHVHPARTECEVAYVLPRKDALVGEVRAMGIAVHCLGEDAAWPRRLRSLVHTRGIDVVHSHSPAPASAARIVTGGRTRHVYTEHNMWERYRAPTRMANLVTFPRNAHVLAVSGSVARSIRFPLAMADRYMPPLETLHHGVEIDRLRAQAETEGPDIRAELGIPGDAPLVSVVANLKPHKGFDVLLRAARLVVDDLPGSHFLLAGVGELEERLRLEIARSGLSDHVHMLGFRQDVPRILHASNVFALASRQEGLPVALLEAMALGVPPVVTSVGGCPEVVTDGVDGRLVPPGDPRSLATAVAGLLDDPELARRLSRAAASRAETFDLSVAAHRVEDLYAEVGS
jgi:glycosyltransferase involved in cell wall biosynthesis